MDRQAWIAVTLCVLGLVAWEVYTAKRAPQVATPPTAGLSPSPSAVEIASATPPPGASIAPTPAAVAQASPSPNEQFEEKFETLSNGDVELRLTNRGGGISEAQLLRHKADTPQGRIVLNSPEHLPIGAIVQQPSAPSLPEYSMTREGDAVEFEHAFPDGVTVRKRFSFPKTEAPKDNYLADMQVEFRNTGTEPYVNAGYFLALGATAPLHPRDMPSYTRLVWSIDGKARAIDVNWFAAQKYPLVGIEKRPAQEFFNEKVNGAEWGAMSDQFFTTILTPLNTKVSELWGHRFELPQGVSAVPLWGLEGAVGMPGFTLPPGQSSTVDVQIYSGPKLYHRLAKLGHDEAEIMNFGFFKLVSQALLNFLNLIHGLVRSYGLAIILLTACVKGVLWPLQNAANRSMRKMSALAPHMQALKEKHKDDPTRMNQELMKLYKEHGVNPVGGCLPMMIQIPIFFGLFSMLGQAAELRNARFLWVKDLSQPDTLFMIKGLGFIPILGTQGVGLPINILPLIMGATNLWLMRMTPKTGDTTQQRMMMFMPLVFLIFCYNFAAALALYYTTQNLFTILQLWQNQRQPAPVIEKVVPAGKKSRKGARS